MGTEIISMAHLLEVLGLGQGAPAPKPQRDVK
jgi:hypothetical protein